MGKITFILGGVRSGKSQLAVKLAEEEYKDRVIFLATAVAADGEMKKRVEKHRESRPSSWKVIEEPLNLEKVFEEEKNFNGIILLDCLGLWVSNMMEKKGNPEMKIKKVLKTARKGKFNLVVVSNETGMGVVPPYPSGRVFRDNLGIVNQIVAEESDEFYFMVAGFPLKIK